MITETREAPETGKPKNKSTIVGMPAVLPPADLAAPRQGRSVPPPPPRGEPITGSLSAKPSSPGAGRSVPPPPPRASVPPGPVSRGEDASATMRGQSVPVEPMSTPVSAPIPSMTARPSPSAPPASRSMPPPPPRASVPPGAISASAVAAYAPVTATPSVAELTPAPGANPVLDMDWDDEELSTQIYDRPEDQLAGESGNYEQVDGGFDDLAAAAASPYGQSAVSTYVPPSNGVGVPGVHISPKAYAATSEIPSAMSHPPMASRAAQVTQPIITQQAINERSRGSLYAAVGVMAFIGVCLALYFAFKTETPGVVQLTTHPTDATVLFDGQVIGSASPFVVTSVTPGEKHLLEVRKDGYRAWSQEVQVQAGQTLQFPVTLQPGEGAAVGAGSRPGAEPAGALEVATGGFSLESTPPGAKVFLDGNELDGVTPLRVANLVPGSHEVRLKLPDFREYTTRLDVKSGVDMSLPRVSLVPERVQVRIVSEPAGADAMAVRGDERRALGRTPLSVSLDNNDTPWTIEVNREKFEPFRQELKPDGTNEIKISAVLIKSGATRREPSASGERAPKRSREEAVATGGGNGTLRLNSRPWSQVFVDGKLVGNTPQMNLSLSEGQHRISLHNPEFNLRKNLTVTIKAGETETQIISLQ